MTDDNHNPFHDWLPIQNAAREIGRFPTTVRGWAETGKIRRYKVGSVWLVNVAEARKYSEEHPPRDASE